jgi:hypothetical protein
MPKCSGHKTDGSVCSAWAMPNGKCKVHGGMTPRGIASPQYKHGRYSKADMPPALKARAQELLQDDDYLSLRENIAHHDAAIMQTLEGMERGEAGKLWEMLKADKGAMLQARIEGNQGKQANHLNSILALIDRGYKDYMARLELERQHLSRAKLVEAEGKRIERAQASVNVAQLTHIIIRMAEVVATHVTDDKAVQAITGEFYALVGNNTASV